MQRIDRLNQVIFTKHGYDTLANENELGVGNPEAPAIGEMQHERSKPIAQSELDLLSVHGTFLASKPECCKRLCQAHAFDE
jgi:hypothetical protein